MAHLFAGGLSLLLSGMAGKGVKPCMDTPNTEPNGAVCCREKALCQRHRCCKLALGLVNTLLMATLTTSVTLLCMSHCGRHHCHKDS